MLSSYWTSKHEDYFLWLAKSCVKQHLGMALVQVHLKVHVNLISMSAWHSLGLALLCVCTEDRESESTFHKHNPISLQESVLITLSEFQAIKDPVLQGTANT